MDSISLVKQVHSFYMVGGVTIGIGPGLRIEEHCG